MFHTVRLSKSDPTPLYIQLACELAKLIQADVLQEGMKLPTIRFLSEQLCINRDTVVSAYKSLENQGLVESHIGKGTYITAKPHSSITVTKTPSQIYCSHLGLSKDFFPPSLCLELSTEIIEEEGWDAFYDPLYRERHLLKHSVSNFFEHLGLTNHFAQIQVIKSMENFLLRLFKYSPKTGICMEAIRDLNFSCYLRSIGAKIYEIPLTSDGMDLISLEKQLHTGNISYIFISSFLQNPTGICYSSKTLGAILNLAETYDCYIIDDITYCPFILKGKPFFPLTTNNRVIYLYQFSKVYLPYIPFSFALLPLPLFKHLGDEAECGFNERLLRHYLTSKTFKEIQEKILTTCQSNYTLFYKHFKSKTFPLTIDVHNGGLSFWIKCPSSCYEALCQFLTLHQVIISPGSMFSNALDSQDHFRLSISGLSSIKIENIIDLLDTFFTDKD